jgi:hypothetical protein
MSHDSNCSHHSHNSILVGELIHHFPYAIVSLALGLVVLSFIDVVTVKDAAASAAISHNLFHTFHFLHLVFAVTGSLITFLRFSRNYLKAIIVSLTTALVFCTISDVIVPYLSGWLLNVHMHLHICLISELHNVIPFVLIGLANGLILSYHNTSLMKQYSLSSHFTHILISSLASLFYLTSEGLGNWYPQMGLVFVLQIIGVVIPCTLADVVVPLLFAKPRKDNEKYPAGKYQEVL